MASQEQRGERTLRPEREAHGIHRHGDTKHTLAIEREGTRLLIEQDESMGQASQQAFQLIAR